MQSQSNLDEYLTKNNRDGDYVDIASPNLEPNLIDNDNDD